MFLTVNMSGHRYGQEARILLKNCALSSDVITRIHITGQLYIQKVSKMRSWAQRSPVFSNRRIQPGLRHHSRLNTPARPWVRPPDFYCDAQCKYVQNRPRAQPQLLIHLNDAKNIFSNQLPNMGAEYVTRLVFDFNAITVMILHEGQVKGAICSRIFPVEEFIEIVFCAVDSSFQQRGYGRFVMNYLKSVVLTMDIFDILTCADNEAVEYFKKQGFNDKAINMDPKRWVGRIKDYEGVTLVHCRIYGEVDYMNFPSVIQKQIAHAEERIGKRMHPGLFTADERWIPFPQAPTFLNKKLPWLLDYTDCGPRRQEERALVESYDERMSEIRDKLLSIVRALEEDEKFGPIFKVPVTEEIAPGYFETIPKPMDLQTMERRLLRFNDYYKKPDVLRVDIELMVENCKTFNGQDTIYYKMAVQCLQRFKALFNQTFVEPPA